MLQARHLLVGVLLASGCGTICRGPACEEDWPVGRVAIHDGAGLADGALDAWADARTLLRGDRPDGASWALASAAGLLAIGQPEAGRAVITRATASGPIDAASAWSHDDGAAFGAAVALGRGAEGLDLWVGAPEHDQGRGAAVLFRAADRRAGADASSADLRILGASPGDRLGERIVRCADLTGDGLPEYAVSIPWAAANDRAPDLEPLAGAVLLVLSEQVTGRSGDIGPDAAGPLWWGEASGDGAGRAVLCDADLDGDGHPDLAIGAPWAGGSDGRVYVVSGAALPGDGRLDEVAQAALLPVQPGGWFGASLTALAPPATDVVPTGSRGSELVVGAPGQDGGRGRALIYGPLDLSVAGSSLPLAEILPEADRDLPEHVGRWLAAGDVDGDGTTDLLVGAPDRQSGPGGWDAGRAWLLRGATRDAWDRAVSVDDADVVLVGAQPFQRVGRAPLVADLDGDGSAEIILPTRGPAP